jgi:hypothetical protein
MASSSGAPRVAAFALALALAAGVADSVYRVPVQVSDSLEEIVAAKEASSTGALFAGAVERGSKTFRPLRRVQARWLLQASERAGLSYHAAFRGLHAALAVALVLLFAGAAPVRGWVDVAAFGAGLTVLLGHHTFAGMLREAYPVNHYAIVTLGCLLVVALARRQPRWSTDVAIAATLAYALLLVESGVLIWVSAAAAMAAGLPGARRSTLVLATLVLAGYVATRAALEITAPGIGEHGSGYLDRFYEADGLVRLFGTQSWSFMAYNVGSAFLSVILSEPRYGVYSTLVWWRTGTVSPVVVIHLASSVLASGVILWHVIARARGRWQDADEGGRLLAVALVVLAANSVLTVSYIKDEIISVAGAFYAMAAYLALRAVVRGAAGSRAAVAAALAVLIALGSALWAFRAVGLHFDLRSAAVPTRSDWIEDVDPADVRRWSGTAEGASLVLRLRQEAIFHRGTSRRFMPAWGERYWVE